MEFAEILDQFNVEVDTSGRGKNREGWLNFSCPFCGKTPYMGFNIESRYANCWNCGPHSLHEVVSAISGLSAQEARALVGQVPRRELEERIKQRGTLKIPDAVGRLEPVHRAYLQVRGFRSSTIVNLWGIMGIGQFASRELRWRIWIPIHLHGEVVSWTSRAIGTKEPRYFSARDEESRIPIEELIYGIDYVTHTVILCEGPLDAWTIGPGAGALMGLRVSPAQAERLSRVPRRVICFDNEPDAQDRARRLCNDLSVLPGITLNARIESGKDANSADKAEIESFREKFLS